MDIYKHPQFDIICDKLHEKMLLLLMDLRDQESMTKEEMGMELIANKKAYGILRDFLKEINFYRSEERGTSEKRSYE